MKWRAIFKPNPIFTAFPIQIAFASGPKDRDIPGRLPPEQESFRLYPQFQIRYSTFQLVLPPTYPKPNPRQQNSLEEELPGVGCIGRINQARVWHLSHRRRTPR